MNQKGGVGKTTVSLNLGAALARLGKRVLLFDLDPQGNLSIHLDVNIHELEDSIYTVLTNQKTIADVVFENQRERLSLVPANIDLSGAEVELVNAVGRETLLRDALNIYTAVTPCDYVIFDCPPSLGLLSLNALAAAHEVFIPIQTEFFALQGLAKLLGVIDLIRDRLNGFLALSNVVPTLYDTRTSLSKEVLQDIQDHFGNQVTKTVIRKNVKLAEAPSYGQTIFEYAPSSNGSKDFMALGEEIIAQENPTDPVTAQAQSSSTTAASSPPPPEKKPPPRRPSKPPKPAPAPASSTAEAETVPDTALQAASSAAQAARKLFAPGSSRRSSGANHKNGFGPSLRTTRKRMQRIRLQIGTQNLK